MVQTQSATQPLLASPHPIELLVVQPTPFCNIDCNYCYLPHRNDKSRMTSEVLSKIFERLYTCSFLGRGVTVVWHAGEPLTVPVQFYERAVRLAENGRPSDFQVRFNFQTNGMLLDQRWCDFIKEHRIRIGVSLDGPKFIHDAHRLSRSGGSTYEKVVRGIELLLANEIEFHIICVITNDTLEHATALFEFFRKIGCRSLAFNVEEIEGANRIGTFRDQRHDDRLRRFLSQLCRHWLADPDSMEIREFNGLAEKIVQRRYSAGTQEATPFSIINVDTNGYFAPFSPELLGQTMPGGDFLFGNVATESFDSLKTNERVASIFSEIGRGVEQCAVSCGYFPLCGGGNPSNKYFEKGTFDCAETRHCITNKQLVVEAVLENAAP